ncbi:PilZ domain-containing protein [Aneurinibacillus migulanus]|uniref:PilZ domain-containing protein n=1 Tax=Aneurinibacillus migulanus TaxID=47500 RepID=UPI0038990DEA
MISVRHLNRRKEERQVFEIPLCSELTISSINKQSVSSGRVEICIKDVSIHGLRSISSLRFPVSENLLLKFQTRIMDNLITLSGKIVWRNSSPLKPSTYEYGVQLLHDEFTRSLFTKLYNDMGVWLKKMPFIPGCRFCNTESCSLYPIHKQKPQ